MRGRLALAVAVAVVLPVCASAQTEPGPPGPYIIDLRGAMMGLPNAGEFYPGLPTGAAVPGRGFGLDVGGHVFLRQVGGARLGVGANAVIVRGAIGPPDVTARVTALAPQVSFGFGTSDGWSHLSAGYGVGSMSTSVGESGPAASGTGVVGAVNFGGGARWFVNPHMATSFDVRFFRFGASGERGTPATMRLTLSVGLSVR